MESFYKGDEEEDARIFRPEQTFRLFGDQLYIEQHQEKIDELGYLLIEEERAIDEWRLNLRGIRLLA